MVLLYGLEGGEVRPRRTYQAVKMVVHEHVGVEHDARHLQVVRQLAEEPLAVVVSPEDIRAAVAAAGNMIHGVRKIDAWWA